MQSHVLLSSQDCAQVLEQAGWIMVTPCVLWILSSWLCRTEPWSVCISVPRGQSRNTWSPDSRASLFPRAYLDFLNKYLAWQAPIRCFRKLFLTRLWVKGGSQNQPISFLPHGDYTAGESSGFGGTLLGSLRIKPESSLCGCKRVLRKVK